MIAPAEASANLARFDGVRYGPRKGNGDLLSLYEETRAEGFGDEVKRRIMLGTYALSSGYYDAYYGSAQRVRTKIADDFRDRLRAGRPDRHAHQPHRRLRPRRAHRRPAGDVPVRRLTVPMPLAGIPAISIPGGLSEGLPVGIQLAGPAFSENRILDAAHALEGAIGFDGSAARA